MAKSAETKASILDTATRRRGRPVGGSRAAAETPHEKLARLEKELQAAREAVEEAEGRKYSIVGRAVLEELNSDPELKQKLADILRRRVKSPALKVEIAPLLDI